ncbi:MAG: tRNA lysidine(34) synthetase TilS [Cyanobacteria bacterium]|jgi:tRNA(Ile)-lysidine synthase|nr:tRNA lysidine(34) synthetase TilS [Cyanobacteria bacterium GSL.Bin21]
MSITWTDFHARVHKTLRQRQLLPQQARVLVAVSGGQDSLTLLKLLSDLQGKWQWELGIAHCDHRWQYDAGMADHVQKVVQGYGIPFFRLTATTPVTETEASARSWRYQELRECCQKNEYNYLVTGHTGSDRAETLLYNLIRGSGSDGLQALTWQRALIENISLVRPLLNFSRSETQQFCEQFQLPVWEDAANENLSYARNRLRQQILPQIKQHFNPQVEMALAQTADILQAETEYLQIQATDLFAAASTEISSHALLRHPLQTAHLALQRRVMRLFWQQHFSQSPTFEQIEELTALIGASNKSRTSSFPGNIYAEVQEDLIVWKEGITLG